MVAGLLVIALVAAVLGRVTDVSAEPSPSQLPRLAVSDLNYEGAFRLQLASDQVSRLGYSPGVIALGADGSSLFVEGHVHHTAVAEYPLVEPSTAASLAELPMTGPPIQPFVRLVDRVPSGNPQGIDRYGGMAVIDGSLVVNGFEYYDADGNVTHTAMAVSDSSRLADSAVTGWAETAGGAHAAGWLSPIPAAWQGPLGGTHLSGASSGIPIISRASVGPSAFVVDLDPSLQTVGAAQPVLDFSLDNPLASDLYNETGANDLWTHLSRAVYGMIVPGTRTYLTIGSSGGFDSGVSYGDSPHNFYKGYYPNAVDDKAPFYWLWDVNDLVEVRQGLKQPHEVRPYDYGSLDLPFAEFGGDRPADVGGATFDPATGRLYLSLANADDQQNQYEPVPLILAYDLGVDPATADDPVSDDPSGQNPGGEDPSGGDPVDGGTGGEAPAQGGSGDDGATLGQSQFCPGYVQSPLHRNRSQQITVGPDEDWEAVLAGAESDTDILLADGEYTMTRYAVHLTNPGVTIRSANGDRDSVVIRGQGYGVDGEGLMVAAADITIADLTMTGIRDHAISIKPESGASATHIYNVHLVDIGTQAVKGSAGADNPNGIVACSAIGYTEGGVQGDYIGAIDLHQSIDWTIRDNYIYNVTGDGTGCIIDEQCGTYVSHPAILIWNQSSGAVIERNTIIDSWRGITLGLGRSYRGGAVRNNFIHQSEPGDAGIELQDAHDVVIEHNTVMVVDYRGAIEYGGSSNLTIRNNLVTAEPLDRPERGTSTGVTIAGNITDASVADLAAPGQPQLRDGSRAIGAGVESGLAVDIDGDSRSGRWDVGADQRSGSAGDGNPDDHNPDVHNPDVHDPDLGHCPT